MRSNEPRPSSTLIRSRAAKFLLRAAILLVALYVVLLIPVPEPTPGLNKGQQPFAWNQDAFWTELEARFVKARGTGCDTLAGGIAGASAWVSQTLDEISRGTLAPQDPRFDGLETNLFHLAPLVAACPTHLKDFAA